MAQKIGILILGVLLLPFILLAQCDDDTLPPSGTMEVAGGGCSPATFRLKFILASNGDDDDDDGQAVFDLSYRIGGQTFQLTGVSSEHEVEHILSATATATLLMVSIQGCTANINQSTSLEVFVAPRQTISSSAPACNQNNGSITSSGNGGTGPYEYSLNGSSFHSTNTFTNLAAGNYTVSVRDANGCISTQNVTLNAGSAPSLSIANVTQPGCGQNNGAFTAQGSGGASPYQFSINNGSFQASGSFSNLASGTYTVTLRDANGCTASTTANLQSAASPSASVSSLRQPTCAGNDGQIQVQAQGGLAPYSYSLGGGGFQNSATFSGLGPGNYTITVRDSRSCQATLPVVLNSASGNLAPATVTGSSAISACLFENLRLQGNLPAGTTGRWTLSNNLGTLTNAQSAQTTFYPQKAGTVEATWTLSANGCANYSQAKIQITIPAAPSGKDFPGIEVNKDPLSLKLYAGSGLVELNVLQQGKKGTGSIGVDHVLIYTPKAGQRGADTLYYSICAAECPNACDTAWVAFVLNDEAAICELEKIDPRALFPEGITPNNDGYNDQLVFNIVDKLGCPSNYAKCDITIFNRWGDKVFVQEPYENQWAGTSRDGGALPHGVYYYVLRIRPEGRKEFVKFGSVSIFK